MSEASSQPQRTWLAPGQIETRKFPVTGESAPSVEALDLASWRLVVEGDVENPISWTYDALLALPQETIVCDIHCVTGWSQRAMSFQGVRLSRVLEQSVPTPDAAFVLLRAYSDRGHATSLPLSLALDDTWLVHSKDGKPLAVEHGYPLRTLTPSRFFFKSLKWVHEVVLASDDQLGYWESEFGYHNDADPWQEQRFVTGDVNRNKAEAFFQARSLDAFRGKTLLGVTCHAWTPRSKDLRDIHLRACDLRGANLQGVDLRGSNLTRCDLRGANLTGADLRGCDIEGANLGGAVLRDCDLRGALLYAVQLEPGADVAGARWDNSTQLLEGARRYMERHAPLD